MTAISPAPTTVRDPLNLGLLLAGAAIALVAAFALPAVNFRGADTTLLGISAWEAVPWLTTIKIAFLGLALAAAFLPRMAALRLPVILAAAVMLLLPSVGALVAAVHPWSDVRAEIVGIAGAGTTWMNPGWGMIALLAATLMMLGALLRISRDTTDGG